MAMASMSNVVSAVHWFEELVHKISCLKDAMSKLGLVAYICWSIRNCRNEFIFSGTLPCHEWALNSAFSGNGEFLAATGWASPAPTSCEDGNAMKWKRPPAGFWKFNCDGAFCPSDMRAALGVFGILRDQ